MSVMWRYGVFQIGQIWCVMSVDRHEIGFARREQAVAAAERLRRLHGVSGDACEVLIVDDAGRLVRLDTPVLAAVSGSE